jgi:hypothetical protein
MSTEPEGWAAPKTDWIPDDTVGHSDLNRWEGNSGAIETGERTLDPAQAPSSSKGSLRQILDWLANRIKAITGATNWYDAPATTLAAAKSHADTNMTSATVHGVKAGTGADNVLRLDSSGKVPPSVMPGAGLFYFAAGSPYSGTRIERTESSTDAGSWLTVGPTGSGANVIWTALDSLPTDARGARLNTRIGAGHGDNASGSEVYFYIRKKQSGADVYPVDECRLNAKWEMNYAHNTVDVELVEGQFEMQWKKSGDFASFSLSIYLEGWYA